MELAEQMGVGERNPCAHGAAACEACAPAAAQADPAEAAARSMARWYRWGWVPLVGGCVVIVAAVLLAFEVWGRALGLPALHPAEQAFFLARAVVASVGLAAWAGWFVFRARKRIESAREQLRKQRARLQEQAWRAEQQAGLAALSRILAHEIRNPLNSMTLHCMVLERAAAALPPAEAERVGQVARVLRDETGRLDRLVEDYLTYGRGVGELHRRPVRLSELARAVASVQAPALAQRGLRARVEAAPDEPELQADPDRLTQALHNLLRNAAEAMPRGGEVLVQVRAEPEALLLEVTDQGPGFAEPEAAFRPFYTTKRQGSGLGLAIVRDVVRAHGGEVRAENVPGGARVTLRLPRGES